MTLEDATLLQDQLKLQFDAQVEKEEISPGRYRLSIISTQFSGVPQLHRQDKVWETLDTLLGRAQTLDISMVLAYAPEEIGMAPQV